MKQHTVKQKTIIGEMSFVDLATGFWCITDNRYRKWRITGTVPTPLQQSGLRVKAVVEPAEALFSIFMSGKPVKILSYEIL